MRELRKFIIKFILLGSLAGPLFVITAIALSEFLGLIKAEVISVAITLVIVLIIFSFMIKKEKKSIVVVTTFLLLFTALYNIFFICELVALGPKGEQIPFVHLMIHFHYKNETNLEETEWNFYEPRCYSEFYAKKLKGYSLEVAAFHYSGLSGNPFHSVPKYLFTKLFCGITDSKAGYEDYKELLNSSGFKIKESIYSFTAKNETLIVYCELNGEFIDVVKVDKNERSLLNQIEVVRGRFGKVMKIGEIVK